MREILAFWHLQEALEEIGKEVIKVYKEKLMQPDANGWNRVASSQLINNLKYLVVRDDREIWIELHLEDYWKYIEYGTQPHWPPFKDEERGILRWVKVRNILPRGVNTSLPRGGKLDTYYKQSAYLIAKHISEEGTPAYMNYNQTIDSLNKWIDRKIDEAITQDLEEDIDFILVRYFK